MVVANPHLAPPVSHAGAPLARARVVAILLHGRGQDPAVMEAQVVRRLALDDVAFVAPAAADHSWYPAGFMAPAADNEPRLSYALERLDVLVAQLTRAGRPLAMIGFSQGACLACEHVYRRRAAPPAALIAFTGGLIGPPGTTWQLARGDHAGMPALFGGSLDDRWVPADRMRETAEAFARAGARVGTRFYAGDAHEVSAAEIVAARAVLDELAR